MFWLQVAPFRLKEPPCLITEHQPVGRVTSEAQTHKTIALTPFSCLDWPSLPLPLRQLCFGCFLTNANTWLGPPRLKTVSYRTPASHEIFVGQNLMAQILPLDDIYIEISQKLTWAQSHGALSTVWTHTTSLQRLNKLKKDGQNGYNKTKRRNYLLKPCTGKYLGKKARKRTSISQPYALRNE